MEIDSDTDRCHTILHKQNEIALSPGSGLRWLPPIEPRRWFNINGSGSLKRALQVQLKPRSGFEKILALHSLR